MRWQLLSGRWNVLIYTIIRQSVRFAKQNLTCDYLALLLDAGEW